MIPFPIPPALIRAVAAVMLAVIVLAFYELVRIPSERDAAVMAFAHKMKTAGAEAALDATEFAREIERETRDESAIDLRCAVFGDCPDGGGMP